MDLAGPAPVATVSNIASADEDASRLLAQRLESIATLTAGVAHDLMNTLASVSMALDLLGQDTRESERWIVGALEEDVRRGRDGVRQIQWLAAAREGEPLIYQPIHLIKEVQKLVRRELPAIEVVTDYPEEVCLLSGEPLLLRQLLVALCLHARSRLPLGGSLTLRAHSAVLDETYAAQRAGARLGPHLRIDVESCAARALAAAPELDDGAWQCPPALLAALERQGGFFEVRPSDGRTSAVRIYLPAAGPAPAAAAGAAEIGAEDRGHGEHVLIVEPHHTLRALLAATVERSGYRGLAAADGAEGLAQLVQAKPPVAAALCAAESLLREGTGVLHAIRRIRAGIPVLVTGPPSALAGIAAIAGPGGVVQTLAGPFTGAELVHALRAALAANADRGVSA
jgi:CheY-like chemotaxis protein